MIKEKEKNVYAGTGISKNDDPYLAGKESVEMAIEKSGKAPDFGIVFCSGGKYGKDDSTIKKFVKGAHEAFMKANPKCKWVGCTTAGEISNYGFSTNSSVALVVTSQYIHIGIGVSKYNQKNPEKTGKEVAKKAFEDLKIDKHVDSYIDYMRSKNRSSSEILKMNPYKLLILGKGVENGFLSIPKLYDNEFVIKGAEEELSANVPICGGAAADDWRLKKNYTFANGIVYNDYIIALALFINLYNEAALEHSYKPTGKVAIVTKVVNDHWIKELNGKNPAEVYAELTGERKEKIMTNPLEVSKKFPFAVSDLMGDYWIKTVGAYRNGGFYTGSIVKENVPLNIMETNEQELIESLKKALLYKYKVSEGNISFAIIFDCAIRLKILGENATKEVELLKKELKNVPFIGFYTFGEFGCNKQGKVLFHNQTISALRVHDKLLI